VTGPAGARDDGVPTGPVWPVRLSTHVWNPSGTAGQALLLHGLGSDGSTWWRVASHLADRGFLVAAPDLRGHGGSPAAADHRFVTLTEDVAVLGTGWDLVVGHSLGGAIAALLVGHDEVEVAAAVLVDPALLVPSAAREPLRVEQRAHVGRLDPATVAAANPRWSATDVDRKVAAAAACAPDVVDRVLDHNPVWDVTEALSHASATRIHVVAADPDAGALLDPATYAAVVDGDRVTGQVVTGAGHSVHRDDPSAVLAAIDRVLELTT
jgi:pimeloyl-ACP methyl ester carboxylesterase